MPDKLSGKTASRKIDKIEITVNCFMGFKYLDKQIEI
jgi:hypothetical protein